MMEAYQQIRDPKIRDFLNDNVEEGESWVGKFGAGGTGGYTGIKTDKGFQVIPMEIGHTLMPEGEVNPKYVNPIIMEENKANDWHQTVESYAGCAPAAINVFAKELGFPDVDAKRLSDTTEGRMITQDVIELDTSKYEQKDQADKLGDKENQDLFKEFKPQGTKRRFVLIDHETGKAITEERRLKGLKAAANEYFTSMGIMLADGANHLSNTMVVGDGFASHLRDAVQEQKDINNPEFFDFDDPKETIQKTAYRNVDWNRRQALESPQAFNVLIKDAGDPSDPKNTELLRSKNNRIIGGFRIGVISNESLKSKG